MSKGDDAPGFANTSQTPMSRRLRPKASGSSFLTKLRAAASDPGCFAIVFFRLFVYNIYWVYLPGKGVPYQTAQKNHATPRMATYIIPAPSDLALSQHPVSGGSLPRDLGHFIERVVECVRW